MKPLILLACLLLLGLTTPGPTNPVLTAGGLVAEETAQASDVPVSQLSAVSRQGTWAYAKPSHGPRYLAIPEGPGFDVRVCGPLRCLDRVSNDAGPELFLQRAGRIGDLSSQDFAAVCGPLSAGLCSGSYTILGVADQSWADPAPHPDDERMRLEVRELPATDTVP